MPAVTYTPHPAPVRWFLDDAGSKAGASRPGPCLSSLSKKLNLPACALADLAWLVSLGLFWNFCRGCGLGPNPPRQAIFLRQELPLPGSATNIFIHFSF
jgi:hypothetical protein